MGPLHGVRILELAGIGPGPVAGTLLSDMGAEVIRIDRPDHVAAGRRPMGGAFDGRGRRSVAVDLKDPAGVETVLRLVAGADGLFEGFRPGVAERLGLGPDVCLARNPRLVYGRMTGWGQDGPLAHAAGHDLNYVALAGALAHIGRAGQAPAIPLNLVGDYGGGALFLAFGMVCALFEASRSGQGQVVDAAMVDGVSFLLGPLWSAYRSGFMTDDRGTSMLDSGAPFYDVYATSDGKWVSVGAIEPQFYAELLARLGIDAEGLPHQMDRSGWPALKERMADIFRSKTRDEWCALLEGTDVCFAPVLTMGEAPSHPHLVARGAVVEADGQVQPAPAPRFSRTAAEIQGPAVPPGHDTGAVLADFGLGADEIADLVARGVVAQA